MTHVIAGDAETLAAARELAAGFAAEAAARDAERPLPEPELDRLSAGGLLAIPVPRAYGGADVSARTLAEVFRLPAAADPNLAQIPHRHFVDVNVLRQQGTDVQREFFFGEVLDGGRFGNAQSEAGTKHVQDYRTSLTAAPAGASC
ncbi:acyl-CoA dehydrogenase family protein [Nonomuraea jiangxiensis]|uniref:Acyl-CoA dehydrogenase, N-terminal domain n=1 Tax=Nonomuraea jiangxiensis TaxID=633440 RepID=A0A1G8RPX5_9ACTN|nr:acyl-CoA dehydrogenase family protein [Nonomuraea jiangxiensis]SDJ18969.1 Acyl-CoA dehydrogenase, N-terminal domain [Nonomuraea jiangxiensis]